MALSCHRVVRLGKYLVVIFLLNVSLLGLVGLFLLPVNADAQVSLSPSGGPKGTIVTVSGSNFAIGDTSCSMSSPSDLIANPECSVSNGVVSGGFAVGNVAVGEYVVTVIGNSGDSATTTFLVTVEQVTMTVSYSVVGGGTPTAPTFNYVLNGASKSLTLTKTATAVSADAGSAWSVTPNPLKGSGSTERWYSNQTLTGTASATAIVFSFQNQYYLTIAALIMEPSFIYIYTYVSGGGTFLPSSGWYNAGSSVTISASANPGYKFLEWLNGPPCCGCSTKGGYCGTNPNPPNFKMTTPITENAIFSPT